MFANRAAVQSEPWPAACRRGSKSPPVEPPWRRRGGSNLRLYPWIIDCFVIFIMYYSARICDARVKLFLPAIRPLPTLGGPELLWTDPRRRSNEPCHYVALTTLLVTICTHYLLFKRVQLVPSFINQSWISSLFNKMFCTCSVLEVSKNCYSTLQWQTLILTHNGELPMWNELDIFMQKELTINTFVWYPMWNDFFHSFQSDLPALARRNFCYLVERIGGRPVPKVNINNAYENISREECSLY